MTLASSWVEIPHSFLVLDAARRDAQWGVCHQKRFVGARIRDRGAAEQLAPQVQAALGDITLDAIIIGNGPGSFAGLRIALAFAKGLAAGLNVPLVAVSSIDAMMREPVEADVAILNAFSGQLFACAGAYTLDALRPLVVGKRAVIDGAIAGVDTLGLSGVLDLREMGYDLPLGVLALGAEAFAQGKRADLATLVPDYGRASTAEMKANAI